jgi:hypothetical protein
MSEFERCGSDSDIGRSKGNRWELRRPAASCFDPQTAQLLRGRCDVKSLNILSNIPVRKIAWDQRG